MLHFDIASYLHWRASLSRELRSKHKGYLNTLTPYSPEEGAPPQTFENGGLVHQYKRERERERKRKRERKRERKRKKERERKRERKKERKKERERESTRVLEIGRSCRALDFEFRHSCVHPNFQTQQPF